MLRRCLLCCTLLPGNHLGKTSQSQQLLAINEPAVFVKGSAGSTVNHCDFIRNAHVPSSLSILCFFFLKHLSWFCSGQWQGVCFSDCGLSTWGCETWLNLLVLSLISGVFIVSVCLWACASDKVLLLMISSAILNFSHLIALILHRAALCSLSFHVEVWNFFAHTRLVCMWVCPVLVAIKLKVLINSGGRVKVESGEYKAFTLHPNHKMKKVTNPSSCPVKKKKKKRKEKWPQVDVKQQEQEC